LTPRSDGPQGVRQGSRTQKRGRPAGLPLFCVSVIVAMVTPFLRLPGWAVRTRVPWRSGGIGGGRSP